MLDVKDWAEIKDLIKCVKRETTLQGVNPFITAIRSIGGPEVSARVFGEWCKDNGIRV